MVFSVERGVGGVRGSWGEGVAELAGDRGQGFVVAYGSGEYDVGDALGRTVHRLPQADDARQHGAADDRVADFQAPGGHVRGGDPALGDDEARRVGLEGPVTHG